MSDELFRPVVGDLKEYKPGKNPDKPGMIKLASNENPFGPSPSALKAIEKAAGNLQIYPDQKAIKLREALAKKFSVPEANIICGNGSDDIMQITCSTFLSAGEEVVIPKNSFSVYELVTKVFGGREIYVELKDGREDLPAIAAAITNNTKIVFLTNPHNPSGLSLLPPSLRRSSTMSPRKP
jgi:histidinol-phosphate aminotransferase